ncbi:hypothetical protein A3C26_02200 [Candidatus Daviesbacteria bacterium RIFCSPHIGHO2_02_FULL_39_12]|nr:MAG: hypothetical protein A3C26_02200 [Candidatus Daviesbacteria bacterium RIFCSPHIGHO2_02_FULL_39_12]
MGFTLIELMIVVTIIAILTVIGITVFTSVQKNARDARRKADINAIANAMEANYDKTANPGEYAALVATFFSSGVIPSDPQKGTAICSGTTVRCYCASKSTTNNLTPAACAEVAAEADSTFPSATTLPGQTTGPYWMVCANLEGTPNHYCRQNIQ